MPLAFPSSPTNGQTYVVGARTWTWNGSIWELNGTAMGVASVGESELLAGAVTQAKLASTLSGITICTSSTKPASPFTGQTIFETDTNLMRVWLGGAWSIGTVHTSSISVQYVVVAGGGGASDTRGGGGGAGGFRTSTMDLLQGTYVVAVGGGGAGTGGGGGSGTQGTESRFHTIYASGGGRANYFADGQTGGSGGGGSIRLSRAGGSGNAGGYSPVEGYAGGSAVDLDETNQGGGGGGGGAGGPGGNASRTGNFAGAGGIGRENPITGSTTGQLFSGAYWLAGGGGGGGTATGFSYVNTAGAAGRGGGGAGGAGSTGGSSATVNTGGGGGGAEASGGSGGSGVVIMQYLTSQASGFSITGGTATTSGAYTIRTFTSSGSLVIA